MTVVSLVVGAVILVAIIGIALYGAVTLPPDARVPVHHGIGGYNNFVSKTVGLIVWSATGALIYGIFVAVTEDVIKPNHSGRGSTPLIIMLVALAATCAFEWGAISAARRNATVGSD